MSGTESVGTAPGSGGSDQGQGQAAHNNYFMKNGKCF